MSVPSEWLDMRAEGNVLTFIDTRFSERLLAERLAALVGPVRHVDVQSVALRSMYTTLARAARNSGTS